MAPFAIGRRVPRSRDTRWPKAARRASRQRGCRNVHQQADNAPWFQHETATARDRAVVARGLHKVAVYRDPKGEIRERSAVCPHLGGIVNWNTLENTWDCPCHGSRFDAAGKVIQGPANSDLSEIVAESSRAP